MSDQTLLRIVLLVAGLAWLAWIWWSGTRPQAQGERIARRPAAAAPGERREPVLGQIGDGAPADDARLEPQRSAEREALGGEIRRSPAPQAEPAPAPVSLGSRADERIDRIVSLHVAAHEGATIAGPELVVAAEKAGLTFGDLDIFHRMVEGRPDLPPVFSVANMVKPGSFDMAAIQSLRTPGVSFFMTLPGPVPALDAWDMMLPAAQRFAELLDARVLDDRHNALGRQTIQHLRDELRAYDRKQEKNLIKRSW